MIKYTDFIREIFKPAPDIINRAKAYCSQVRGEVDLLIGVHVRHGDFIKWNSGRYWFPFSHYLMQMEQASRVFNGSRIRFLIFSDDPELNVSLVKNLDFVFEHNAVMYDLTLMSMCDYIIAPLFSSFSGWASFWGRTPVFKLNGQNVVQCKDDFVVQTFLNNSREYNKQFEVNTGD
nr:alpha-1,2-fucosyltransferase [Bacteroidota bacterium]